MPMVRVSQSTLDRLRRRSKRTGIPMAQLVAESTKKEVKKLVSEKEDTAICDECEEEIPEDAVFCPYCGVEFEETDEEPESEDSEETEEVSPARAREILAEED